MPGTAQSARAVPQFPGQARDARHLRQQRRLQLLLERLMLSSDAHEVDVQRRIAAPPEAVWEVLTDLDNAAPLCGTHHHMIDSALWRHVVTRLGNGTVSLAFHRRT